MAQTSTGKSTWLNQLPDHSVFQLDEQEYLEWARHHMPDSSGASKNSNALSTRSKDFSMNAEKAPLFATTSKLDRDSFGLEELKDDFKEAQLGLSCMVVHGQDLFLAVGRQVRYASLSDLKKNVENISMKAAEEFMEKKQHKVLKIQNIDFDIRRLVLNPEGKLLSIVGDEKIVIAALPKALKQNPRTVNCKSYVLGEFYHINKGPSKIVKVLWHPLSKGFTDILVMTQDGILRMYNVASDVNEPDQVFNFFGAHGHRSSTYGLDVVDDLASFCFGSKFSEWGQLTVYCLTQSGNLYMMCPVMPQNCIIGVSTLDEIRSKLSKEATERPMTGEERSLAALKEEWLERLLESAQPHPFSDEVVMVQRPDLKAALTARQGPFLFQPAPYELKDDENRAYDILSLDTEVADVIVMAHSSGRVDVCMAVDPPAARWVLAKSIDSRDYGGHAADAQELPVVSVYETIDLGLLSVFGTSSKSTAGVYALEERRLSIPNYPVLVQDTLYGDTFYIYHEAGAHCISVRPWLEKLTSIFEATANGQSARTDSEIKQFYGSSIESSVCYVVNTRPTRTSPAAPVVACAVVADPYLEYSLLMLTSSLQLIGIQLSTRPSHGDISDSATSSHLAQQTTALSREAAMQKTYMPSLSKPGFEEQGGLLNPNGLPLRPKVVLPPGAGKANITVTEENLKFLNMLVQGIRESLREVYSAGDLTQQRVDEQLIEYSRQQGVVNKTHEHTQGLLSHKTQEQANRLDTLSARQMTLMARADNLLQKLMESKEPELSPAEKVWVSEVAKSERVVKTYSERRHKVQAQYDILKRRMKEIMQEQDFETPLSSATVAGAGGVEPKRYLGHGLKGSVSGSSASPPFFYQQPRRTATRFGTVQQNSLENDLSIESRLLESTIKQVKDLSSRMEALQIVQETPAL